MTSSEMVLPHFNPCIKTITGEKSTFSFEDAMSFVGADLAVAA